jgi:hypothetical protein
VGRIRHVMMDLALFALALSIPASAPAQNIRVLTATRDLHIDAARADLSRVTSLLVGRNGDIIMRQMSDGNIRYFSAQGTPFTYGRQGDGPGEFRNLREAGFVGDTLWAADIAARRVTFVSPARTTLRTMDYPSVITTQTPVRAFTSSANFPVAIYADGSRLMYAGSIGTGGSAVPPWSSPDSNYTRPLVRTTQDGQFVKVVAWRPQLPDCGVSFPTSTGGGNALIPFCAGPLEAISADGDRVALITRTIATTTEGSYRLTAIGANGDTIFSRTITFRPVAIPREKNDSAINSRIASYANRPEFVAAYKALPLLTHYPPVRSILIGRDKTIWIEVWTAAPERSWQVLDSSGSLIATLKLPPAVTLLAAELTTGWGIETDIDGLSGG